MPETVDIEKILLELELLPEYDNQIMLQTVEGHDHTYGTGKLIYLNHKEKDFNHFCFPELKYTNKILNDLGMVRSRVMKMKFKSCYTYHQDPTQRIHIPLITNENCFMIIDDELFRYPADGNYYIVDTTKKHTFVNASLQERIHIVGCIT